MLRASARALKYWSAIASFVAVAICAVYVTKSVAQSTKQPGTLASSTSNASPIYGVTIPPGYRDWKLIAVDQLVTGKTDQLRAQLGNEIAIKAFKEGKVPFPDGAIIAGLHWNRVASEDDRKVLALEFPDAQSFVVGDFKDGKPNGDEAFMKTCFPCHVPAKAHDYVFAQYAPTP